MTNLEKAKEWLFNLHVGELQRIYSILKEDVDIDIVNLSDFETLLLYNLRDSDIFKPKLNINLEHHSSLLVDFENPTFPVVSIETEAKEAASKIDIEEANDDIVYNYQCAFETGAKSKSSEQFHNLNLLNELFVANDELATFKLIKQKIKQLTSHLNK